MELDDTEIERYARHLILDEIGDEGQERLREARVAIVGLGGIGSPAAQYLASSGVGTLRLIDPDCVDLSNLQRQVIHTSQRIDQPKVISAQAAIKALNPLVTVEPIQAGFAPQHLADCDLVIDGTDSYDTRLAISDATWTAGLPLVMAAAMGFDGQLALIEPAEHNPCYRCLFPTPPAERRTCAEVGVFAPLVGLVGTMAAGVALQRLIGMEVSPTELRLIDGRSWSIRPIKTKRRASCKRHDER